MICGPIVEPDLKSSPTISSEVSNLAKANRERFHILKYMVDELENHNKTIRYEDRQYCIAKL